MAQRRCLHTLTHYGSSLLSSNPSSQSLKTLPHLIHTLTLSDPHHPLHNLTTPNPLHSEINPISRTNYSITRHLSSKRNDDTEDEEEMEESSDGEGEGEDDEDEYENENENENVSNCEIKRGNYSAEEKEEEAAAIGYKVIGPLQSSDRPFKLYELVFAVVQIGSHQFKVSNGDCIYTERLKFCEVNDKLILNKVLLLGSKTQTIVGRPTLPNAAVQAVVEEHALDAKVIIFKKKRRKNYRRTKGHRQELTKLRITDIQGIEKPENIVPVKPEKTASPKPEKAAAKKQQRVAVTA